MVFRVESNQTPMGTEQRQAVLDKPVFGTVFTDQMVDICWSEKGGWHRPRVQPYGPIPLDPAASVLHYGQEIFEGMKACCPEDVSRAVGTQQYSKDHEHLLSRHPDDSEGCCAPP